MSMIGALQPVTAAELEQLKADPSLVDKAIQRPGEVSLEKMWHGLHFLFTGSADKLTPPLGEAVMGGTGIGRERGYGPVRYLTPAQVASIAAALKTLTREELRRRFQPGTMAELDLYPMCWDEPESELFDELMFYYKELATCYEAAASRGDAMLLSLM